MMSKIFPQSVEEFGKDWGEPIGKFRIYVSEPSPQIKQIRNTIYEKIKIPEQYHGHVDTLTKVIFYMCSFMFLKTMFFLVLGIIWFFGIFIFIGILGYKAYLVHISGTRIELTMKFFKELITQILSDTNQYCHTFVSNFQTSYNKIVEDNADKLGKAKNAADEDIVDVNQSKETKKSQ